MAVYLTFSRGAIAALVVGVAVVLALSPTRSQVRAALVGVAAGLVAALARHALPAVESLEGGSAEREGRSRLRRCRRLAAAAAVALRAARRRLAARYALPRRAVAVGVTLAVLVGAPLAAVALDRGDAETGATASRLDDLGSNRYDYWDVALGVAGRTTRSREAGIAGFRVDWLQRARHRRARPRRALAVPRDRGRAGHRRAAAARRSSSSASAAAAPRAVRRERELVAGAVAGVSLFAVHAAIDWDWELPAVALPALVLAGVLLCRAGATTADGRTS